MENAAIARLLSETADLMEIAGQDGFRVRSYRNAASAIESFPERLADIAAGPDKKLTDVPSVGKAMAEHIEEILERGSFARRDELLSRFPPTALEFLKIQGLGPKSVALIFEHFRASTIDDLEKLCQEHKLQTLPRMGAKLEEKVLRSISAYRKRAGRFLLDYATQVAEELEGYLKTGEVSHITHSGSLRRGKETIGDVDLLVVCPDPAPVLERFATHPKVSEVLGRGENKSSVRFGLEGIQVDVRALPASTYGAALQYFTGSKEHNVALRQRALKMGYTLSEYGLSRLEDEKRVAGETEEEIYQKLGLAWIPPELRENQGEIEAAEKNELPRLLTVDDIRGDIHMHTTETDGRATLEEMAGHARERGYEYIAITDHSKALAMANGLDEKRVVEFARRVRKLNESGNLGIHVYSGLECDIRRDGTMDIEDEALAELDLVIASVHSHMNLEPEEMTARLLRAIENPHVRIVGHPTGRILMHRDAFPFDFDRVAAAAAGHNVALEINASPERLDLSGPMIRAAKAKGVRFTISTDAHHPKHLLNMRYGVQTARRGWLEKKDVLNALPAERFLAAIRQTGKVKA